MYPSKESAGVPECPPIDNGSELLPSPVAVLVASTVPFRYTLTVPLPFLETAIWYHVLTDNVVEPVKIVPACANCNTFPDETLHLT